MSKENIEVAPKEVRYGYNEKGEVLDENVTFTLTLTMRKRWAPQFMAMLQRMKELGNMGSSRHVTLFADGDGDFRPTFESDTVFPIVQPVGEKDGDQTYDAG